ncbi:MAG: hypothetical protein MJA29_11695 [Candidatus Omnitrophica bacterium]|nr:hypothetical protein [Candidatus Omnitrophota bacterium]
MPLTLYAPDVKLLGHNNMMLRTREELSEHGEGLRLLEFDVPFGYSAASHQKDLQRRLHNQHITGNITPRTLQLFLEGWLYGEKISV